MIARKPSGQLAATNHGPSRITHHFSFNDWNKRALMTCLASALLGGLVTTTAVAMLAYLLFTNSHI